MTRFLSRKFLLAAFFAVVGSAALFAGKLTGTEFVTLVTLLTTVHNGSNIVAGRYGSAPLKVGGSA